MAGQITPFGTRPDGASVHAITLRSDTLRATVLTQGAVLQSLYLAGIEHSLTLGFRDLAPYLGGGAYFGCVIAPVANRIGGAMAQIAGQTHRFEANENANTLHSASASSHAALWTLADHSASHATLTLRQPDGAGGFPGTKDITATYRLSDDTLHLEITATTDAPTLMNIAHHGYWNMDGTPTWAGHTMCIKADHILPTTVQNLPTGAVETLTNHPHDFRQTKTISPGERPPLDHNFCLATQRRALTPALTLTGVSGTRLELATTEPGLQIFDAAPINTGTARTLHAHPYGPHCGLAIEPQSWPDAPNHPHFPAITLTPNQTYRQHTTFRFSAP
ncbi:aldose epimerase family protein [Oceaniglobus ichthyenteri]|uniref:aldose epimerase family protein n=1 Tax=Oceaniglobus ichthyenteri TaxID=2136177 RepID=UPI000D36178E|nr:aldose epimerase family protein [Oceaniglobus ichthyenteri]